MPPIISLTICNGPTITAGDFGSTPGRSLSIIAAVGEVAVKVIVQKFGGSSVADLDRIERVAKQVVATKQKGYEVVVVVSAMGKTTDELKQMALEIDENPPTRELDMLLSVGERISTALMAIAIQKHGVPAISLTGSQCGIMTSASHSHARIIDIRPFRVLDELEKGHVVVVAGFQGTSYKREITTIGRGGSDTTAVALAAALNAERCEIYSDIAAVHTADPKVVLDAKRLAEVTYDEMLELSRHGAKVLNADAIAFAKNSKIAIYTRATFDPAAAGTVIRANPPDPPRAITGVASKKEVLAVSVHGDAIKQALELLASCKLLPDFVCSTTSNGVMAVFSKASNVGLLATLKNLLAGWDAKIETDLATVTAIGDIAVHEDLRECALPVLQKITGIKGMILTPSALTLVVPEAQVDEITRTLHKALIGPRTVDDQCQ